MIPHDRLCLGPRHMLAKNFFRGEDPKTETRLRFVPALLLLCEAADSDGNNELSASGGHWRFRYK